MRTSTRTLVLALAAASITWAAAVPTDLSGYRKGPVRATVDGERLTAEWTDEAKLPWKAVFSLDPSKRLIEEVSAAGKTVIADARPDYQVETGKRRRGWNAFFDYPPSHPEGTQHTQGVFQLRGAQVRTVGDRLQLEFDGLELGPFTGGIVYTIFPGSRLIQQEAVARTYQADTAYYYDAGLEYEAEYDVQPGRNMATKIVYYDTEGKLQTHIENGFQPERTPVKVRYRTLAIETQNGGIAAFPPPHQYFFPRDFTSNLGYLWHRAWRGRAALGIRQIRDTNWQFYPWMNAPPGTEQRMSLFLLLSPEGAAKALEEVTAYTNRDRYRELPGYRTLSSHWHLAYTVQAMEHGFDWSPPFKPVLRDMGVDASIIMDFHGDGHPRDLTNLRLNELKAFFEACRAQSDKDFLLIPSEEANVHLGGHWAVVFPKPVYWFMGRPEGGAFEMDRPGYGKVYSTADAADMLALARKEGGWMYQTHARTKGSTGFPDQIRDTAHFQDPSYFGAGWKAMPSDPSSPRLGDRVFTLLDDMNNWGLPKRALGEVDVFQFDHTHELYAHMNVNYVRADRLPDFEHYDEILKPLVAGEFFVTTGEVLLPKVEIQADGADGIRVQADVQWTLPLKLAEIIWGDGERTERKVIPLNGTRAFGADSFEWRAEAPGWKWARVAVWDVAADGAFVNPVRRENLR